MNMNSLQGVLRTMVKLWLGLGRSLTNTFLITCSQYKSIEGFPGANLVFENCDSGYKAPENPDDAGGGELTAKIWVTSDFPWQ